MGEYLTSQARISRQLVEQENLQRCGYVKVDFQICLSGELHAHGPETVLNTLLVQVRERSLGYCKDSSTRWQRGVESDGVPESDAAAADTSSTRGRAAQDVDLTSPIRVGASRRGGCGMVL